MTRPPLQGASDLGALVAKLEADDLRTIVAKAAEHHEEVARAVRLAASRSSGDLAQLRAEVDSALRTRRFLRYRESAGWAMQARPVLEEIRSLVQARPSAGLVPLIERAIGHVVKVILHADDSDGTIGDLARELLDLHAQVCGAGVADPVELARWMVRFSFDDQDFFEVDPVRYAAALGELGLAAYRREIRARRDVGGRQFAAKYAEERLAVLDGDVEAIVRLLGEDLTKPYQFIRVSEAMAELGRDDEVLAWATRGIAETDGWQVAQLYDLAASIYARREDRRRLLELRRGQHSRMPSSSTYNHLRQAAEATDSWPTERPGARAVLAGRDLGGLVDVLLSGGEPAAAWQVTLDNPGWDAGEHRWLRLAEAREPSQPADGLEVYLRLAEAALETTGRAAYTRAAAILKRAGGAAAACNRQPAFAAHVAHLREAHRRRPTLIAIFDKAGLP